MNINQDGSHDYSDIAVKHRPHIVYYVKIEKPGHPIVYKFGLTANSIQSRFAGADGKHVTLVKRWEHPNRSAARAHERELLTRYAAFKYIGPPVLDVQTGGNTELVACNVLDLAVPASIVPAYVQSANALPRRDARYRFALPRPQVRRPQIVPRRRSSNFSLSGIWTFIKSIPALVVLGVVIRACSADPSSSTPSRSFAQPDVVHSAPAVTAVTPPSTATSQAPNFGYHQVFPTDGSRPYWTLEK